MEGMAMTAGDLKARITDMFENLFPTATEPELNLVPRALTDGKMYEAFVLAVVAGQLATREGLSLRLANGHFLQLKSSHGPINRRYPYIEAYRGASLLGEIWTDVEFLTLSYAQAARSRLTKGDYHELDILMVTPGASARPRIDQILLGVECKNLSYDKGLLKEILGIRRELSLLDDEQKTAFSSWPRTAVRAKPPSCLLVYSSSPEVLEYANPGEVFGIDFYHEALPTA
jgi:hypothetical protein